MSSHRSLSVKAVFLTLFVVVFSLLSLQLGAVHGTRSSGEAVDLATTGRYDAFLLATELRQSSDILTALARTYVATGEERWREYYETVLDIRSGRAPRPDEYVRGHWDYLAAGEPSPRTLGPAVDLLALMRQAGFSEAEFEALAEAERRSAALAELEGDAMTLAERAHLGLSQGDDSAFAALLQAMEMVNGEAYHAHKANIMASIDTFYGLLDQRTTGAIEDATQAYGRWSLATLGLAIALVVAVALLLAWGYRSILAQLGAEPAQVRDLVGRVADGDLSQHIDLGRAKTGSLLAALAQMQASLRQVVRTVRDGSESVAIGANQIAAGNTDLSQRTEEQAANLQQTAASMEQIASTVRSTSESASEAEALSDSASQAAAEGGLVVTQVVTTMNEIQAASSRIANIIGVMDEITFQTNILALNASVEAARAGEQGRGFAVVAGEVRKLAQRSAESAREIRELIQDSVAKVEAGSGLVNRTGKTMEEIVERVNRVSQVISEIRGATAEQTAGLGQINMAVSQLDEVTQQNAALVEEATAAAESLDEQARRLVKAVSVFRLGNDNATLVVAPSERKEVVALEHRPLALAV
jgi:methyl-accepting chemotaxis protein